MRRRRERSSPAEPFSVVSTGTYAMVCHYSLPVSAFSTRRQMK